MTERRRRMHGLTLVEMLIVLTITAILASALGYAFTAELTMQRTAQARRAGADRSDATERRITLLLKGAKLSAPAGPEPAALSSGPAFAASASPGAPASPGAVPVTYFRGLAEDGASDLGCARLTWTTTAPAVPLAALSGTEDFEAQQQARGPVGGLAEVSLSATPIGDAGGRTGLFERVQRPSDGDPTQGGFETVLDPQVARIGFQFWDGQEWVSEWPAANPPRLPAAVRVRYTLKGRPDSEVQVFDVPLPASDVDAQKPQNTGANE